MDTTAGSTRGDMGNSGIQHVQMKRFMTTVYAFTISRGIGVQEVPCLLVSHNAQEDDIERQIRDAHVNVYFETNAARNIKYMGYSIAVLENGTKEALWLFEHSTVENHMSRSRWLNLR